ncbi:hypothetical protein O3M35_005140 [Rhynocoris fuscipes]|uniref:Uncharacterized protein n=1 Tax=Rhynocoris fuscipes TaxID=488301 RepID=A0AAW1DH74_9HEMI
MKNSGVISKCTACLNVQLKMQRKSRIEKFQQSSIHLFHCYYPNLQVASCLSTAIENGRSPKPVWQPTYNVCHHYEE